MKIMTWNVNRFNGTWDYCRNDCDIGIKGRKVYAKKIIEKLNETLKFPDDIVILQEVPYCNGEWQPEWQPEWEKLFEKFKVMFWFGTYPERDDFYYKSQNITIAVTIKEGHWCIENFDSRKVRFGQYNSKWNYVNRYVELRNEELKLSLLGFHVKLEDRKEQLEEISKEEFSFIAGDFNYNALLKNTDEISYEKIKEKYEQKIPEDVITHNQDVSGIDKIFINKKLKYKELKIEVMDYIFVNRNKHKCRLSDHNICLCDITI